MTPIRPNPFPQTSTPARADTGRLAAQKAFFQMATASAQAPVSAAPAQAPAAAPTRVQRMPDPAAEAPAKVLRPGSLLDIRV